MKTQTRIGLMAITLLATATASSLPAMAAGASLSGPSTITFGEKAVMNGGNFPANMAVKAIVKDPSGKKHNQVIAVNEDGTLSYEIPISGPGMYTLQIANNKGKVLGKASLMVNP